MNPERLRDAVHNNGWAVTSALVSAEAVSAILNELQPKLEEARARGGVRNLLASSDVVRSLAAEGPLRDAAVVVLGPKCGAVRAILFDKTPAANWKVVWHQDLTIAVAEERPTPGYGPWSVKDGVTHVQPPVSVLEAMVAVRLHLDECSSDNGPVRVLSGSHAAGRLSPTEIEHWRGRVDETECLVQRGGLLLFRPLLLHASSPATRPAHRRVLHIEYGPPALPNDLSWYSWVPARQLRAA